MKKLILHIGLLAFLSVGLMFQPFNAQAATIGDLEQKQESIKDKKSNLDKETQEKQSEIDKLEEQKKDASKDLNELLENIEKTNLKLKKQQEAVTKEKQEIKRIADKIQALKKKSRHVKKYSMSALGRCKKTEQQIITYPS
ncbi:Membrane-bound metallopeptidase [Listeria grayi]|uniref:Membrane-bound metallopeptidase n=1 Tax=Listeria grayi TaxID=1641 RepID=A0A378MFX2_LISGR|nr:Membrane-bound metallopeptidase [Listeria grayi]